MVQDSIDVSHYGPWNLYIPTAYLTVIARDYDTTSGMTIDARIREIPGIKKIIATPYLAANNVVLCQMTQDVIRLVTGMPIQTVEWSSEGNMVTNYKVMTIMVPQIRTDASGNAGVVHYS